MRAALQKFHVGFQPIVPLAAVRLAEVEAEMQGVDSAIALLDDALAEVQRTGQRWYDAEIYRQRGRLLLRDKHSVAGAAKAAFESALMVARDQRARMFELRAAIDLTCLLRDQGQPVAARELLTPVCALPATKGGGPDLKTANALLNALP